MRISDWSSDVCSSDLVYPPLFEPITPDVDGLLKQFAQSSQLGYNAAYIEDLYEQYLVAPDRMGPQWKAWLDGFKGSEAGDIHHSARLETVAATGSTPSRRGVAECEEGRVTRRVRGSTHE